MTQHTELTMIQSDLNRNLEHLRGLMGNSSDFVIRELTIHGASHPLFTPHYAISME
ncbi:hypothetical protein [Paenibacillus mucilaginosus]|uniref:hypothetical protein n=1 Tax=Paenibacillus mucilaginosus TaxID=61624 RepID=UPI001EE64A46|nr:hypothetical protein [Paenibacillus mucilaginosus]